VSKYDSLTHFLRRTTEVSPYDMPFEKIETVLGFPLPPSAHRHRGWWANEPGTHVQARAWLDAGWKVWSVDLPAQTVRLVSAADPEVATVRLADLSAAARALINRHVVEHGCSSASAIGDLLTQAAIDRRRRLLDRFPLTGHPSAIDSADLIREDRDGR
jgi:hypothetical protein